MVKYIDLSIQQLKIPQAAHNELLKKFKEYLYVGGMPEAVATYCENGSLQDVADVHSSIVNTYLDDFSKYARHKDLVLLQKVFHAIPRNIGKKVKYTNLSREDRTIEVKYAIDLLSKAMVCQKVVHSHCSGIPLFSDADENIYKLIFLDIGLANHISGLDWRAISDLDHINLVNQGMQAEQFVGQELLEIVPKTNRVNINYWLREGKANNAEVDYVISFAEKILPIEVKSGKSGSLKSLQQFVLYKKNNCAVRFDLNMPELQKIEHTTRYGDHNVTINYWLLSLPLYAVEALPQLVAQWKQDSPYPLNLD